ncbi:double-strand break repair helicase AddA [Thalassococcus sp. CAU 1522]|uniref:DNA 3'-5' helicase n=1 Tax=Thalassococcus arenae TaxID=2851652 RepID=A0ABS6N668_9RHOB|nr:double-strand break repair helicase AddA [Thalassococcus arenae]MBV2359504.1 double-strand break repair helicase AddA [Thalassococcus arenae]
MTRHDATQRQIDAARPDASTWLSANAGSGKTRVLTDRVARLLLDGVLPEHILCLTYTKAAATEMQNRLFKRLGDWAMRADDDLASRLAELGADARPNAEALRRARTLFARAIETPGGLRIQTIHSFCAGLLRRFPLEAQVSPQFTEMEDRAAQLLRAEILERMADGPEAHLVAALAPHVSGDDPDNLLKEVTERRETLSRPWSEHDLRSRYGLPPDFVPDAQPQAVFAGIETDFIQQAAALLIAEGGGWNSKTGKALCLVRSTDLAGLQALEAALLTQSGTINKQLITKGAREGALAGHWPVIETLAERALIARQQRIAHAAFQRDLTLHRFADAFLPAYAAEKQRRGWLDFDDLILRARDLLNDRKVADWVLYRLDGGIDHILVDEAQDTSPRQWQVIERLAAEITAGEGARSDTRRTIFVVGDKKQSIYSFQGADPDEFDRMRAEFQTRLDGTETPLQRSELAYSFRSAAPILRLVDATFEGREKSGFAPEQGHIAFKNAMPGRVDLWPVVEPVTEDEDEGVWFDPVDRTGRTHHTVILANRIAHFIRAQIDLGTLIADEDDNGNPVARPMQAGDVLILVQRRKDLFVEIIRACKQAGLPIAGADRLKVMSELAVKDIAALLRFLATPEDDLSLAAALRSPLFAMSEQALFDLAHRRSDRYLWPALRNRADEFPGVMAVLNDLRDNTDYLRPYDLIERILTRHHGRPRLIGRLGPEAEDGINALLQQALAYEQSDIPSLTGFLQWMQTDDLTIKRAPDAGGERVRVMTVHGAKGLEAPVVILPDCADTRETHRAALLGDSERVMWKQKKETMPQRQSELLEHAMTAAQRERDRLLYVAMTRAEKWLIVAAAGETKSETCWYNQVADGMQRVGASPEAFDFGSFGSGMGLGLSSGDAAALPVVRSAETASPDVSLPDDLARAAPPVSAGIVIRSPSDLGGAKALPGDEGDDSEAAKARGTAIHRLLEALPALPGHLRTQAASKLIDETADQAALVAEVLSIIADPDLKNVFAPGTLAEVPITADLPELGRIHGVIDRLIVTPEQVVAVDFKTNRVVPETPDTVPEGLLRQMGAYAAALAQIYPDRPVQTALLWTANRHYMPLPHDLVTQALARAAAS